MIYNDYQSKEKKYDLKMSSYALLKTLNFIAINISDLTISKMQENNFSSLNTLFNRIGYVLYRGDKGLKSVDVICTPNESSKYEWRGTDGSSVECVKGKVDIDIDTFNYKKGSGLG